MEDKNQNPLPLDEPTPESEQEFANGKGDDDGK